MYIVVPRAGTNLFGSAQIGEYFRDVFSYAIIALALVIHAWRKRANAEAARSSLRSDVAAKVEVPAITAQDMIKVTVDKKKTL